MKSSLFFVLMFLFVTTATSAFAAPHHPSTKIQIDIGAGDGSPVDEKALGSLLKIVGHSVATGAVTNFSSDYGMEGEASICLDFDSTYSTPEESAPIKKKILAQLRTIHVSPKSHNEYKVAEVPACNVD